MKEESKPKTRTREELVLEALKQLEEEKENGYGEYEIHYVVPYDEYGGEVRGVISNFMASSSADALRYAVELLGFPEVDPEELTDDRREFARLDGYGIVKIRKKANEKEYSGEDMLKLADFIFTNYHREVSIKGTRIKSEDNRNEILPRIIKLFKLPRKNILTDKYKLYEDAKSNKPTSIRKKLWSSEA